MKNRSICEQIKHQEQKALYSKRKLTVDIENLLAINIETHTTKQERQILTYHLSIKGTTKYPIYSPLFNIKFRSYYPQ